MTRYLSKREKIAEALNLAIKYGGVEGDHHKAWVIDQMVRVLAGRHYESTVGIEWDVGVPP